MTIQLSQKERMFLEDAKVQEDMCVQKYKNAAEQAQDAELKQLFTKLSGEEQHHLDTVNQLLQGQEPDLSHNQQQQQPAPAPASNSTQRANNLSDNLLCVDLLSTEKHVSSTYDMDVFESANPVVRQTVQHLQQDEQTHGEELFNYMNSHGMYDVK